MRRQTLTAEYIGGSCIMSPRKLWAASCSCSSVHVKQHSFQHEAQGELTQDMRDSLTARASLSHLCCTADCECLAHMMQHQLTQIPLALAQITFQEAPSPKPAARRAWSLCRQACSKAHSPPVKCSQGASSETGRALSYDAVPWPSRSTPACLGSTAC